MSAAVSGCSESPPMRCLVCVVSVVLSAPLLGAVGSWMPNPWRVAILPPADCLATQAMPDLPVNSDPLRAAREILVRALVTDAKGAATRKIVAGVRARRGSTFDRRMQIAMRSSRPPRRRALPQRRKGVKFEYRWTCVGDRTVCARCMYRPVAVFSRAAESSNASRARRRHARINCWQIVRQVSIQRIAHSG